MSLARELLKLGKDPTVGLTVGVVTDTSPFTVQINGDTVDIPNPPRLDSYTPALDDVVIVLRPGPAFVVLGKIV